MFEREASDGGTVAFFYGANGTLCFRNVFGGSGNFETNVVQFKEWVPETGEFIIGMSHSHLETAGSVDVVDALEATR